MEELKSILKAAAANLTLDELVAAINESTAASSIPDPKAFAAYLKSGAAS